jgi:hypothetical protein
MFFPILMFSTHPIFPAEWVVHINFLLCPFQMSKHQNEYIKKIDEGQNLSIGYLCLIPVSNDTIGRH